VWEEVVNGSWSWDSFNIMMNLTTGPKTRRKKRRKEREKDKGRWKRKLQTSNKGPV
jgi:hypothetical protein